MDRYILVLLLSIFGLTVVNNCLCITSGHYTHEWAANIEGGEKVARELAQKYGFQFIGKIMEDYYLLRNNKVSKRSIYPSRFYHRTLAQDNQVKWLEQQVAKKRVKRSVENYPEFNDPKWPRMWYFTRGQGLDMNVRKAWEMGVTGKGVAVTILDDGIETEHPDLKRNYDEKASYDVNGHDNDPTPRYDYTNENRHGTRCAGEVAAQANNSECSIGAAYDAKIGGVRMLDGDVTDSVEATSLALHPQHIQIYSASWGPDDDGRTVDGPATLARKAFYDGITRGRGGLGSIFVWASGNGGRDDDSCNCDGYTNTIHTLSISSVTENGKIPWYSEACSSTLATTYSSGSSGEKQIVTTDIRKSCTETHTGTSASAPLAAGLCALALQANPMLTWRDLQHIVVMTSKPDNLHDPNWVTNGVNRKVSHSFGYGLMDAAAMVTLALNWTTVPPQRICEVRSNDTNKPIPMNGKISVPLTTNGCVGTTNHVKYLEHVQARITLKASKRGEIQIYLTSPLRTTSVLLAKRSQDTSREGFNNWAFMTTHNWGETAQGQWVLVIENGARSFRGGGARLKDWVLVLYGTDRKPQEPLTTTTTPTTPTTAKVRDPRNPDPINPYDYSNSPNDEIPDHSGDTNDSDDEDMYKPPPRRNKYQNRKNKKNKKTKKKQNNRKNYHYMPRGPYKGHLKNEQHMCIFETLAKQSNMSAKQYFQKYKKDLTPESANRRKAELTDWTLIMYGTDTLSQSKNVTASPNTEQAFTCSGISSDGICIECRPGYYKLKDGCVPNCPEHYYGMMQILQVRSTTNNTIGNRGRPNYQRQGFCHECNEACRTCKGPDVADCFQCTDGYEKRDGLCQKKLLLNFLDPDMLGFFIWVIVLCVAAILLFVVIFGLLQARDRRMLCWKGKRHLDSSKCEYNGINLTQEELENDLQNVDIIRNRTFRHGSIPESQDPLCRVHVNFFETRAMNGGSSMNGGSRSVVSNSQNSSTSNFNNYKINKHTVRSNKDTIINHCHSFDDAQAMLREGSKAANAHYERKPGRQPSSSKGSGRKHTNSYVSYDINSTLTQTLSKDYQPKLTNVKDTERYHFHGSRSASSLRH